MTKLGTFACALLLSSGLAAPAFAANAGSESTATPPPSTSNSQSSTTGAQGQMTNPGTMHVTQRLREDLAKAGFKDIRIMPSSFLVRAKDSEGNPVMMVINPDSITEVTEQNLGSSSAGAGQPSGGTTKGTQSGSAASGSQSTAPGKTP